MQSEFAHVCEGHGCAELIEEVNIESWEISRNWLCADCADADFERRALGNDLKAEAHGQDSTQERK